MRVTRPLLNPGLKPPCKFDIQGAVRLLVAGGIVCIIIVVLALSMLSSAREELAAVKSRQQEILALKREFLPLRQRIQGLENKKHLSNVRGIVHAVDEVFEPLGLKGKIKSVKQLGTKESKGAFEEKAEVVVQAVNMNEMVNILYNMENAPMLLIIKKINIETSFENPELLNMNITLSLIKPA